MSLGSGRPSSKVDGAATASAGRVTVVVGSEEEKEVAECRVLRVMVAKRASEASRIMSRSRDVLMPSLDFATD